MWMDRWPSAWTCSMTLKGKPKRHSGTELHCTVQCLVLSIRLRSLSGEKEIFQCF
jgi:hypothetical protein